MLLVFVRSGLLSARARLPGSPLDQELLPAQFAKKEIYVWSREPLLPSTIKDTIYLFGVTTIAVSLYLRHVQREHLHSREGMQI